MGPPPAEEATEPLVPGALKSDTYAVRSRVAFDDAEEEAIRFPARLVDATAAGTPSTTGRASEADGPASTHALYCFAAIGFANVICQAIFSVLPTFFPPVAKSKGMSDFVLGVSFAAMPAVVFSVSAIADQIMYAYGRRRIFILGNVITAAFTALLGAATLMPDGAPFAAFCLVSQIGQGFGSALAEASSFALIAELFPRRVTFYFGLNETFTGLGVAIGPPIGGLLFAIGGFWCPFVTLACALLPGIVFIHVAFRPSAAEGFKDEVEGVEDDVSEAGSVLTVLRVPGVATIMLACVLAESAITFLMPTFAEHALATGLGTSAPAIGMYFTANALLYTVGAPLVGLFTTPANARRMIVCGMVLLSGACFLIGPSEWVRPALADLPARGVVLFGFALLGLGEGLAMAPLMEDMMVSCGANSSAYLNSLSGLMAASFALGQVVGPLAGTILTAWLGFNRSSTALATALSLYTMGLLLFGGRLGGATEPSLEDADAAMVSRHGLDGASRSPYSPWTPWRSVSLPYSPLTRRRSVSSPLSPLARGRSAKWAARLNAGDTDASERHGERQEPPRWRRSSQSSETSDVVRQWNV
jgi:MFS family permease